MTVGLYFLLVRRIISYCIVMLLPLAAVFIMRRIHARKMNEMQEYAKISTQEKEDNARAYGQEGAKSIMLEKAKNSQSYAPLFLLGVVCLVFLPPVGIAIIFYVLKKSSGASLKEKAEGRDPKTLYRVNFLIPALQNVFGEETTYYQNIGVFSEGAMNALPEKAKRISKADFLRGENLVKTTVNGVPLRFSRATCYAPSGTDDDGDPVYKCIWQGMIYETQYKTRLSGSVRIIPTETRLGMERNKDYRKLDSATEVKVETDNIYFNEHFDVYAQSKTDALYVLNPYVINYFCESKVRGTEMALYVTSQEMYITHRNMRYDVFNTPFRLEEIQQLSVENKCREVAKMAQEIIHVLEAINGKAE